MGKFEREEKYWTGKLVMPKRDITNRGGDTILKGTPVVVVSYYRKKITISTDVGRDSIVIRGVDTEDVEMI